MGSELQPFEIRSFQDSFEKFNENQTRYAVSKTFGLESSMNQFDSISEYKKFDNFWIKILNFTALKMLSLIFMAHPVSLLNFHYLW